MLTFYTHTPSVYNIGDDLCAPNHYFHLEAHEAQSTLIIGGGAFKDMGLAEAQRLKPHIAITWAIGRSVPLPTYSWRIRGPGDILRHWRAIASTVARAKSTFAAASTRDTDLVGRLFDYVPCPSVFHSICDVPPGAKIGVFLNADAQVTSSAAADVLDLIKKSSKEVIFGTNSEQIYRFSAKFKECGVIITNSYHIGYWSLLSGRSVRLIGYSSKFVNLLNMFGIPRNNFEPYIRGDARSLVSGVNRCFIKGAEVQLNEPSSFKELFRDYNIRFAQKLVDRGFLRSFLIKSI